MAGHRDTVVTVTVGTETKGLRISEAGVDALWPNATPQAVAEALIDGVQDAIRQYVIAVVVVSAIQQWFDDYVTETD